MEIYTTGIMIERAIVNMWAVKSTNGDIHASSQLKNLEKRMAEPGAHVGCWASIKYIEHKSINSRRIHYLTLFVNLNSGDYAGEGKQTNWDSVKRVHTNIGTTLTGVEDEIAKIVVPKYLEKWEKKLKKEIV